MGMVSTRRQRCTVVPKVKISFRFRECVHVEAKSVEIICQVIGGKEIYGGCETRLGTNFQQALEHFKWCKASYRISVSCHLFPAPSSKEWVDLISTLYSDVRK